MMSYREILTTLGPEDIYRPERSLKAKKSAISLRFLRSRRTSHARNSAPTTLDQIDTRVAAGGKRYYAIKTPDHTTQIDVALTSSEQDVPVRPIDSSQRKSTRGDGRRERLTGKPQVDLVSAVQCLQFTPPENKYVNRAADRASDGHKRSTESDGIHHEQPAILRTSLAESVSNDTNEGGRSPRASGETVSSSMRPAPIARNVSLFPQRSISSPGNSSKRLSRGSDTSDMSMNGTYKVPQASRTTSEGIHSFNSRNESDNASKLRTSSFGSCPPDQKVPDVPSITPQSITGRIRQVVASQSRLPRNEQDIKSSTRDDRRPSVSTIYDNLLYPQGSEGIHPIAHPILLCQDPGTSSVKYLEQVRTEGTSKIYKEDEASLRLRIQELTERNQKLEEALRVLVAERADHLRPVTTLGILIPDS